jgi:hypothetical protein
MDTFWSPRCFQNRSRLGWKSPQNLRMYIHTYKVSVSKCMNMEDLIINISPSPNHTHTHTSAANYVHVDPKEVEAASKARVRVLHSAT